MDDRGARGRADITSMKLRMKQYHCASKYDILSQDLSGANTKNLVSRLEAILVS